MNVLLIATPTFATFTPLNLMYLAGTLDANGIDVTIIDWNIVGKDAVGQEISKGYDLVGLSVMSSSRWVAFDIATRIRELSPKSKIVMGGPHATLMPAQCKKYADYVVKGDGELQLLDICQGRSPVERTVDLDSLPFPAYHKVDLSRYPGYGLSRFNYRKANGVNIRKSPRVSILATRGCKSHCKFCSSFWVQGKYRMRNPKKVVDELDLLCNKYGISNFYFNDDSFYLDKGHLQLFCLEILRRKIKIAFHIETRADILDEWCVKPLKWAGCYRVQVGFETGSQQLLDQMGKGCTLDDIARGIENCKKVGLRVDANLIVGNVGETDDTIEETRKFLRRTNPTTISSTWNGLMLLPGTAIYQRAKREGRIDDSYWASRIPYQVYAYSPEQINGWNRRIYGYNAVTKARYLIKQALFKINGGWENV